jgi:hypothetical protein
LSLQSRAAAAIVAGMTTQTGRRAMWFASPYLIFFGAVYAFVVALAVFGT